MQTAAIDLKPSFTENKLSYASISLSGHDLYGTLRKELIIEGDTINKINYLKIGDDQEFAVSYEDIESVYYVANKKVICPKGKYHPQELYNKNFYELFPKNIGIFEEKGNWDLKCYFHGAGIEDQAGNGFLMLFYLINKYKTAFNTDFNKDPNNFNWEAGKQNNGAVGEELYDFRLKYGTIAYQGTTYIEYPMNAIVLEGNDIKLKTYNVKFESHPPDTRNGVQIYSSGPTLKLSSSKKYNQAYINDGDNIHDFYFISYNNISDFTCGYSTKGFYDDNFLYFNDIKFESFSDSPFEFVDEVEIKEIKIISNYRYAYYILYNKQTSETYYGLFDIKTNKIMFNTNEALEKFLPYSSNSMLAIKGNLVYRICPILSDNGTTCLEDCSDDKILIRDVDKNFCGTECPNNKYLLIPDNICDSQCNTNIYVVNETNKRCGLCKDMNDEKPYRFIGGNKCLSEREIQEGAYEYNTKLKLLKCKSGYQIDPSNSNSCITNCHRTCKTCSDLSTDDTDTKCLSCNYGYDLDNGQCIKNTVITTILNIPSTIPNIPSTIPNIPSTFPNIPSTIIYIPSTIPNNPSTIPNIPSTIQNIPSTILNIPSTIPDIPPTTIIQENPQTILSSCPDEKCLTCNDKSNELGLCLSCNEPLGYKKVNYTIVLTNFLNCMKPENPQTKKYYYNETLGEYRPCYKTCKQCSKGGDAEKNYCLECENGYMFRPGNNSYNNCVVYSEFYYISNYNQFKSLAIYQCPEEAKYYIKDKKSCIDDCKKDEEYKYLYNGNCIKECPDGTQNENYICILNDNKCTLGKNEIYLDNKDELKIIPTLVKSYISEFQYTDNYISLYQNDKYSIMIYKNGDCISELSLEMPDVDFQSCYEKVKTRYGITQKLIIVIVKELINSKTYQSFYHPLSGFKLDADEICKNETIVVKESLNSVLDNDDTVVYEAQNSLMSQGINIFDLNDPFYTDLCYDFENPMKKDIPLSDRIKILYPDVELCDDGCEMKSINLEDMTSTCDCLFNDLSNSNIIKENPLMESAFGEVFDIINNSNILVFKCFKNIFTHFSRSIGGWITLSLILGQIGLSFTFFFVQSTQVSKYLYNLTKNYIKFISVKNPNSPPKKVKQNDNNNEIIISNINTEKKSSSKNRKRHNIKTKNNIEKNSADDNIIPFEEKKLKYSEDLNMNTNNGLETLRENEDKNEIFNKEFFIEYMSTSPEDMEFDDAVAKDKRKY